MKKYFFIIAFLCSSIITNACDICGCSSGALFIGPYHFSGKHFIGMRYSYRNYFSRMADDPTEFSKDHYQTTELWGGISIGKRWQLMAFVPYNINRQEMEAHPHTEKGLGDITLLSNYRITKQFFIGAGIKAPTGKFDPSFVHHAVPAANVQPGTGSLDFILNATGIIALNKWSLHSNINYKINGSKKEFRFGDRLNISSIVTRPYTISKLTLSPYAGVQYENLQSNKLQQQKIDDTGGQALLGTAGFDMQIGKINIGANMQLPVAQNFSHQQTETKSRGMIQLSYIF